MIFLFIIFCRYLYLMYLMSYYIHPSLLSYYINLSLVYLSFVVLYQSFVGFASKRNVFLASTFYVK